MADVLVLYIDNDPDDIKRRCINMAAFIKRNGFLKFQGTDVSAWFKDGRLHNETGPAWQEPSTLTLAWAFEGEVRALQRGTCKWSVMEPRHFKLREVANINFQDIGFPFLMPDGMQPGARNFSLIQSTPQGMSR